MIEASVHRTVQVPAGRLERWIHTFTERHGGVCAVADGALELSGNDGATATLRAPFDFTGDSVDEFVHHIAHPPRCAVILVRRGGFAVAVVDGGALQASRTGRRHVQGRTSAGGWSQQRFARRRQKQADELADAAVGYVVDQILPHLPVEYVVTGGDRPLIEQVLGDSRLRTLAGVPRGPHLDIPDPTKDVVASLPERLATARIELLDADRG